MTFNPIDRDVKAIFFFFITIISNKVSAHILELLPQYQQNKRFYVDRRSDLWGDPNHNKSNSMRIYDISAEVDLYKAEDKNAFVQADVEGLSTDRADLLVGRNRILVGGDLRNQSAGFGFVKRVDHSGWCIAILLGRFHGKAWIPLQVGVFGIYAFEGSKYFEVSPSKYPSEGYYDQTAYRYGLECGASFAYQQHLELSYRMRLLDTGIAALYNSAHRDLQYFLSSGIALSYRF